MSGILSATFRARTAAGPYSLAGFGYVYDANTNGSSEITATFASNGVISYQVSVGDEAGLTTTISAWHDAGAVAGIGSSRWAKKTDLGDLTAGTLATTLTSLSTNRTIQINTVGGERRQGNVLIEIYSDAGGTTKVGQVELTLTADS